VACSSGPIVTVSVRTVDADSVFSAQNDSTRRRILAILFDAQPHGLRALSGAQPKHLDLARKHLDALVKAGLVVARPDPADQRRNSYLLAPTVKTATSPEGQRTMDFGYCILRC